MNIVREQRGENNSLIRVTVGEADYGQEVEKSLREYKRKANIPGFRPGMVPMGIVKKMYGKGVLAEQSYRQASNAVFEYLQKAPGVSARTTARCSNIRPRRRSGSSTARPISPTCATT